MLFTVIICDQMNAELGIKLESDCSAEKQREIAVDTENTTFRISDAGLLTLQLGAPDLPHRPERQNFVLLAR